VFCCIYIDGGFEIPTSPRPSTRIDRQVEDDINDIQTKDNSIIGDNILADIAESGYKIFQSPVDLLIVICVKENEKPEKCLFYENKLTLMTTLSRKLVVPLPEVCASLGKKTCSYHGSYVMIKIEFV
jgi:hypothetical protein